MLHNLVCLVIVLVNGLAKAFNLSINFVNVPSDLELLVKQLGVGD